MSQTFPFEQLDQVTQHVINTNQQLLLVAGASASGKSFIAEKLADSLRDQGKSVLVLSSDNYYSNETALHYVLYGTFDHPNMIHYDTLGDNVESLLMTGSCEQPNYSFVEKRTTHYTTITGTYDHIIVEGLYSIDQLDQRFPDAMTIFVQSSHEEIIFRRIVRDQKRVREPLHMMINNIGKAFPMRNIFGKHQEDDADLIITNDYAIMSTEGTPSQYDPFGGDVSALGALSFVEHAQHFVYSNQENDESDIILTEVYRGDDPLLKYVIISAVQGFSAIDDKHIEVTLYDPGSLTDMHILFQTAGLTVIDRFSTTKSYYENNQEQKTTLLERDGTVYQKVV